MGKGASKTGGAAGRKRTKDSAMAAAMKDVHRTTTNCPICHKLVPLPFDPIQHKCRLSSTK